jgi:hypothetical protein
MNEFRLFLSAVVRHWFAWVIGAVVAVFVRFWPMVGEGNPPRWLFWTAVWVGLFLATFFAWREERKRAETATNQLKGYESLRPEAVLRLLVDGAWLLLEVRNDGATGQFTATIEADGGYGGRPLPPVPAVWDLTNNHHSVELRPAESAQRASQRSDGRVVARLVGQVFW